MPELFSQCLLLVPTGKQGAKGEMPGDGLPGDFVQSQFPHNAGCSRPWCCPAEMPKLCLMPSFLSSHSSGACVLRKSFWHWDRESSQPCLIPTATPRACPMAAVNRDASSWSHRFPTAPASSTQSLMLVPISCILICNQSFHLAWFIC